MLYKTENPHGGDVYEGNIALDFSANTNPFGTPEGVKAAVSACLDRLSVYPDPYCRRLTKAIAAREGVPNEYVLCGAGAAELIYSFAFAERPGRVAELAPTFAEYTLPLAGAQMNRFFLKEENGFRLTADILDFIGETRPDAVFLCNPNNPTGAQAEPGLIAEAAKLCRGINCRLFLDECFMDLADEPISFVPKLNEYPNVIILKAFTKGFGMAGLRLGCCLSADSGLLSRLSRAAQPWNVSTAAQEAGIAALSETAFLERTRALIKKERPRMAEGLKKLGLAVFDSGVNFLLVKAAPGLDERLLKKGIKIRNCANFHGLAEGFYRIAVKLPEENDSLLEAIKEVI
ncbi:MAG: aminotransferase class I/II-fold pyridoxal phosphate-dependent enzyme [Clostridiales bacterium]|nr:aminotransferase class I/II-fold pyridoxal phosphate-dependent enzyme [Clostridiales bacterium]